MLLLLTTNMLNIPYRVLMQCPLGINYALYLKLGGLSSITGCPHALFVRYFIIIKVIRWYPYETHIIVEPVKTIV